MELRSYARITWVDGKLGLWMVNSHQAFFLFAESVIMLSRKPYILVKYADRYPERCIRRHGGEIWARLDLSTQGVSKIELFFVLVGRRIKFNPAEQMQDVVAVHDYEFPAEELEYFMKAIETMHMQRLEYDMLRMHVNTSQFLIPG